MHTLIGGISALPHPHFTHNTQHTQYFSAFYHFEDPHIRKSAHPHFTGALECNTNIVTTVTLTKTYRISGSYTHDKIFLTLYCLFTVHSYANSSNFIVSQLISHILYLFIDTCSE